VRDIFYAQTKIPFLVVPCIKFVWCICVAAQTQYCCESD